MRTLKWKIVVPNLDNVFVKNYIKFEIENKEEKNGLNGDLYENGWEQSEKNCQA